MPSSGSLERLSKLSKCMGPKDVGGRGEVPPPLGHCFQFIPNSKSLPHCSLPSPSPASEPASLKTQYLLESPVLPNPLLPSLES